MQLSGEDMVMAKHSKNNGNDVAEKEMTILNSENELKTVEPDSGMHRAIHDLGEAEQSTVVEQVEQPSEFTAIQAAYNDESSPVCGDKQIIADYVSDGRLTVDQFSAITGVDYDQFSTVAEAIEESKEADKAQETGKLSNLPDNVTAEELEMKETLSHYKPLQAADSNEAREHVKEAIGEVLEHNTRSETSLRSGMAISVADFLFFNTEGLGANGNKVFHVSSKTLYKDVLKSLSELVDEEDWKNTTVQATCGIATETAILLMAGKLRVGFFVLPPDRKAVREHDVAFAEYPTDIQNGHKVLRAVCIPSNEFAPRLPVFKPGSKEIQQWVENESSELLLAPGYLSKALYASLWDKDGEFDYDPLRGGKISSFLSGKDVAERATREKVRAERDAAKAKEDNNASALKKLRAGDINADEYKTVTGEDAPAENEPETRQVAGTVGDAEALATSDQTVRALLNKNNLTEDDMGTLRNHYTRVWSEMMATRREAQQMAAAHGGDVMSSIPAFCAIVRERGTGLPENAIMATANAAHEVIRRAILPRNKALSRETMRALLIVKRDLDTIILDPENGPVIQRDADENPIAEFTDL